MNPVNPAVVPTGSPDEAPAQASPVEHGSAQDGDRLLDYAHDRLVGVFDDAADVQATTDELAASGFAGAFDVHRGAESAGRIDFTGTAHGPLSRMSHALHTLTAEGTHMDHYERELLAGHAVVIVNTASEAQATSALRIFEAHHARFVNQFGMWAVETLRP